MPLRGNAGRDEAAVARNRTLIATNYLAKADLLPEDVEIIVEEYGIPDSNSSLIWLSYKTLRQEFAIMSNALSRVERRVLSG